MLKFYINLNSKQTETKYTDTRDYKVRHIICMVFNYRNEQTMHVIECD